MEAVGQLTGGVAHDFNNLLTIIIGNIGIAKRGVVEARAERALANALAGAERAAQLTQRLLAFSRQQPLNPTTVDANKLIVSMSDLLTRSLGENIALETISGAGLWKVEADVSELEATLLNLALNARDAMPDGGKLTIETSNAYLDDDYCRQYDDLKPGQYVLIAVSDNGVGMSSETIERAFEPFFTTKETGKGTGLGLSQVYGFIKQSGGHVKIYSEPGEGTSIKLYLPRHDGEEAAAPPMESAGADQGRGETILVVEDDEGVRQYASEILRDLNYQVIEAKDSAAALAPAGCRQEIRPAADRRGAARQERPRTGRRGAAPQPGRQSDFHDRVFAQRHRAPGPPRPRRRADFQAADRGHRGAQDPSGARRVLIGELREQPRNSGVEAPGLLRRRGCGWFF